MNTASEVIQAAPAVCQLIADSIQHPKPEANDRAAGVMLGLAVGNLLGLEDEGSWYWQIDEKYPGGITEIDRRELHRPLDDDLAQAVELADAILSDDETDKEFARLLVGWLHNNGRGCGRTTRYAIHNLAEGMPTPLAAKRQYEFWPIAPNGGVMRCAPVGVAYHRRPEQLVSESASTCAVTHYALASQWSCVIINAVIALLLNGETPDLASLMSAAEAEGAPDMNALALRDGIPNEILSAIASGDSPPESADWLRQNQHLIGHTLLATQAGLWAAVTPLDFEAALVEIINAGGDTDTNGAVAGAVLGARYGADAIPPRWQDCVSQHRRIESLGNRLFEIA